MGNKKDGVKKEAKDPWLDKFLKDRKARFLKEEIEERRPSKSKTDISEERISISLEKIEKVMEYQTLLMIKLVETLQDLTSAVESVGNGKDDF